MVALEVQGREGGTMCCLFDTRQWILVGGIY